MILYPIPQICLDSVLETLCKNIYFFFPVFTSASLNISPSFAQKEHSCVPFCASNQLKLKSQKVASGVILYGWSLRQKTGSISNSESMCLVCDDANHYNYVQWCQTSLQSRTFPDCCESFSLLFPHWAPFAMCSFTFACQHKAMFKSVTSIPVKSRECFCSH